MMTRIFIAVSAALLATAALAQDAGLYPAPSAPDASFLRAHVAPDITVTIDGSQRLEPASNGMTAYVEISPGTVMIKISGSQQEIVAEANMHYTYLPDAEGGAGRLMQDTVANAPGEVDLLFYNLADLPSVDLYVPDADVVALSQVAAGEGAGVALRAPLTLGFAARTEGVILAGAEAVELRPRTGTSIVLTGTADDGYTLVTSSNSYDEQ